MNEFQNKYPDLTNLEKFGWFLLLWFTRWWLLYLNKLIIIQSFDFEKTSFRILVHCEIGILRLCRLLFPFLLRFSSILLTNQFRIIGSYSLGNGGGNTLKILTSDLFARNTIEVIKHPLHSNMLPFEPILVDIMRGHPILCLLIIPLVQLWYKSWTSIKRYLFKGLVIDVLLILFHIHYHIDLLIVILCKDLHYIFPLRSLQYL